MKLPSSRFALHALTLAVALPGVACAAAPAAKDKPTGVVKILALNDFHGQM